VFPATRSGHFPCSQSSAHCIGWGLEMLQRLLHKVSQVMHRQPLDVDYLQFVIDHEMVLLRSLSDQVEIPQSILNALIELSTVLSMEDVNEQTPSQVSVSEGKLGRPNYNVSPVQLQILTEMFLSITQIAKLLGISVRTVKRRLHEYGISIKQCYSTTSDEELDNLVSSIKTRTPHVGYRMMKGMLQAMGHHVQWKRVYSSMHRVDSAGIFSRMTRLGFVVRRTYSVQGPLYLMHIDTNHKLIRFGLVIFGGIDGYSRKIMYLGAAANNRASTALAFFLMLNRIERLWRDVWMAVSSVHYETLHNLEDEGLLDPTDGVHMFCAQHTFLPRLQRDLDVFRQGWDNHPLRTERNLSPQQLWTLGLHQNPVDTPDTVELDGSNPGVILPSVECPLSEEDMARLRDTVNVTRPSQSHGETFIWMYLTLY
uniref:Integrase core domain-containing protein n=1 Tax=Oreochromis aureus TaxID=47969 RepID=A0AAZ1Y4I5_OREAU